MNKRLTGLMVTLCAVLVIIAAPADAQQIGNYCVRDFQPGANCTANDVRIEQLTPVNVIEDCVTGTPGWATVVFEAMVSASGSPNRYDIGIFIGLGTAADEALTGDNCLHDYLEPPLTATPTYTDLRPPGGNGVNELVGGPWLTNEPSDPTDTCGDIGSNTEFYKTLVQVTLACVNRDFDVGDTADAHVCVSWDNNTNSTCTDVSGAFPGTNSKCGCSIVDLGIAPTPVDLVSFTVE